MTNDPREMLYAHKQHVLDLLSNVVHTLDRHDSYLLETDLKEEAINHRFAVYLEQAIASDPVLKQFSFSTDCEYNKFGLDRPDLPKRKRDRRLRPDIIVHQRGREPERINLLTVEVKKTSTVSNLAKRYALWKSQAYRSSNLAYIFAAYICLNTGDDWKHGDPLHEFKFFTE